MVSNYNQILEEKTPLKARTEKEGYNVQEATSFTKCYSGKPTNVYSDGKFVMLAPKAGADLYEEGIKLNHCVGAYTRDVMAARGSMLIYFLRKAKSPKEPLVTVQINRDKEKGGVPSISLRLQEKATVFRRTRSARSQKSGWSSSTSTAKRRRRQMARCLRHLSIPLTQRFTTG